MSGHTERAFESAIEAGLTDTGGYEKRSPSAFNEALALLPEDVSGFLKDSQPARWQALEAASRAEYSGNSAGRPVEGA